MTSPHHFVVEGPCRDYDYSTFCEECNSDALDCATEWMAERFDALDVGDNASVTMKVVAGAAEECHGDSCKLASKPAPHIVTSTKPVGFHCLHCGDSLPLSLPVSVDNLVRLERRYRARHVECKPKPAEGGGEAVMLGPNHKDGCDGSDWRHSGDGYNRVRVCQCGAEDHDPTRESFIAIVDKAIELAREWGVARSQQVRREQGR